MLCAGSTDGQSAILMEASFPRQCMHSIYCLLLLLSAVSFVTALHPSANFFEPIVKHGSLSVAPLFPGGLFGNSTIVPRKVPCEEEEDEVDYGPLDCTDLVQDDFPASLQPPAASITQEQDGAEEEVEEASETGLFAPGATDTGYILVPGEASEDRLGQLDLIDAWRKLQDREYTHTYLPNPHTSGQSPDRKKLSSIVKGIAPYRGYTIFRVIAAGHLRQEIIQQFAAALSLRALNVDFQLNRRWSDNAGQIYFTTIRPPAKHEISPEKTEVKDWLERRLPCAKVQMPTNKAQSARLYHLCHPAEDSALQHYFHARWKLSPGSEGSSTRVSQACRHVAPRPVSIIPQDDALAAFVEIDDLVRLVGCLFDHLPREEVMSTYKIEYANGPTSSSNSWSLGDLRGKALTAPHVGEIPDVEQDLRRALDAFYSVFQPKDQQFQVYEFHASGYEDGEVIDDASYTPQGFTKKAVYSLVHTPIEDVYDMPSMVANTAWVVIFQQLGCVSDAYEGT